MPQCSICWDCDHNRTSCHYKCLPNYVDYDKEGKRKNKTKISKLSLLSYYLKGKEPVLVSEYNMDGRAKAKKDEDIRVKWICDQINQRTEVGLKIMSSYKEKFGKEIRSVVKKGGNNIHYDILIQHTDGTTIRCEEKGTQNYTEVINEKTSPYENSVQFSNLSCKKFSISKKYLKLWYDINVKNTKITHKYNLPDPPPFEEWLLGGPYVLWGDPTSEYSLTLKKNYREIYPKRSMGGESGHNEDYRKGPNEVFELNETDKETLKEEIQQYYSRAMNEKEVWLQTTGTIEGLFSFKWFDKIEPQKIIEVELVKGKDIKFKCILEDKSSIVAHLRWGNGCGFSCFRMDLK